MTDSKRVKRITLQNDGDANFDSSKPVYGIKIRVDGVYEVVEPKNPLNGFDLATMQKEVGGYVERLIPPIPIEVVGTKINNAILIFDEDGQMKQKPVNIIASGLVNVMLAGDVLVIDNSMWR